MINATARTWKRALQHPPPWVFFLNVSEFQLVLLGTRYCLSVQAAYSALIIHAVVCVCKSGNVWGWGRVSNIRQAHTDRLTKAVFLGTLPIKSIHSFSPSKYL